MARRCTLPCQTLSGYNIRHYILKTKEVISNGRQNRYSMKISSDVRQAQEPLVQTGAELTGQPAHGVVPVGRAIPA